MIDSGGSRRYVYGPVYSRRLGRSLGLDLIPFKTCSYDCIYCQLGRTTHKTSERREYAPVDEVLEELARKLAAGPALDIICLAGSGEPTLHARLGEIIDRIKRSTNIPVAVLTNGSLLWLPEVREELARADLVLPSLDAGNEKAYRHVNRPCRASSFARLVAGLTGFAREFRGAIWLEVFLVGGITGIKSQVQQIAEIAREISPQRIQLNTVARPTAEEYALAVSPAQMEEFRRLFTGAVDVIAESPSPTSSAAAPAGGGVEQEILALLRRRPCTVAGVAAGLDLAPAEASKLLHRLRLRGVVWPVHREGSLFYDTERPRHDGPRRGRGGKS
jgi:wyosine [tRNA(Phe)-imidazoG37] synthetase (radical SAM superfamily)